MLLKPLLRRTPELADPRLSMEFSSDTACNTARLHMSLYDLIAYPSFLAVTRKDPHHIHTYEDLTDFEVDSERLAILLAEEASWLRLWRMI